MAIDHRIPLMTETPRINTPFENLRVVMDAKAAEQQVQGNRLKLQEAERAAKEQAEAQRILQESGGDWEVALPRLRQVAPGQALAFEKHLGEQRKAGAEAVKLELANERDMTERGLALLRAAKAAPEMYGAIRQYVGQMVPDLGPLLPEQYDPATLDQLETMGLTAAENIEQKGKALQLFADGKLTDALGTALSAAVDEEDWNEALEAAKVYGVPAEVRAMFGQWSPDAPQRAAQLTLSPKERADIQDAEVGREIQQGQLDVARGQLDVARGRLGVARQALQQSGASSAGGPAAGGLVDVVMANPQTFAELTPTEKAKIMPQLHARGFRFPSPGSDSKPSTGAEKSALGFYNRARQALEDVGGVEQQIAEMTTAGQAWLNNAPHFMQSQAGQIYNTASKQFTEARLRKESGAAIADHEYANDRRIYFAQPGDSKATLLKKQRAREAVLAGMSFGAGRALREFYGEAADDIVRGHQQLAAGREDAPPASSGGASAGDVQYRFSLSTGKWEKVQ